MKTKNIIIIQEPLLVLLIILIMLKLPQQINWSWLFILSPIIGMFIISLFCHIRNELKKDIDCFYQEGHDDYLDGAERESPYEDGTDGEYGWNRGWDAGSREKYGEYGRRK